MYLPDVTDIVGPRYARYARHAWYCWSCQSYLNSSHVTLDSQFLKIHNIYSFLLKFIVLITFLYSFIMSKYCTDHFLLSQLVDEKSVEILFKYSLCIKQNKFYVFFDNFKNCSECIYSKKKCSLIDDSWSMKIYQTLYAKKSLKAKEESVCIY